MMHRTFWSSDVVGFRKAGCALGILVMMSQGASSSTVGFKPAVNYAVGTSPVAVAVGDFNGDGNIDMAVADGGDASAGNDGGISILLGNGDATFQAALDIAADKNPVSIAAGDFNGDNRLDLALIDSNGNVGILLGNGDGTFHSPVNYAAGSGARTVVINDFNGDHRLDLVVANVLSSTVSVLLGNGDGTFQPHVDYAAGGSPQGVSVADFNRDGKADLAVPSGTSGVAVLLGKGDGTFQPATFYDAGPVFGAIAIVPGDFNGDGKADVIVNFLTGVGGVPLTAHYRGDMLAGNGDGTFQLSTGVVDVRGGSLSQTDFDGDTKVDLVQPGVLVWAGNGNGTFQTAVAFAVGSSPSQMATADLNHDKSPDIVVANQGDNTVSVLVNIVSTDFSIFASTLTPETLSSGQRATSTVSMNLLNAFDNPVSLACSVQPAQAGSPTCSLNPNSITFDASGKATAEMTITAGTTVVSFTQPPASANSQPVPLSWLPIVGFAVAGAGFRRAGSRRRRPLALFVGCVLFAGLIFQTACGGSSSGPKSQAYTITVTGKAGSTQHSTTVKLTVQ